jgi:hypothetical protein
VHATPPDTALLSVPAYRRARDGRITYLRRCAWNDLPSDALTETDTRLNIERLLDLGYVLQPNANGTITFWPFHASQTPGSWERRRAHIQALLAAEALYASDGASSAESTRFSPPDVAQDTTTIS